MCMVTIHNRASNRFAGRAPVTMSCRRVGQDSIIGANDQKTQRAIFQPVLLATILTSTVSLSVAGAVTADTVKLYLLGLPAMLAGTWVGLKLYGKLDDALFRKIILVLLLVSGVSLVVPLSVFR